MLQPVFPVFLTWRISFRITHHYPQTIKVCQKYYCYHSTFLQCHRDLICGTMIFPYQLRTFAKARGTKTGRDLWIGAAKTGLYQISPNRRYNFFFFFFCFGARVTRDTLHASARSIISTHPLRSSTTPCSVYEIFGCKEAWKLLWSCRTVRSDYNVCKLCREMAKPRGKSMTTIVN